MANFLAPTIQTPLNQEEYSSDGDKIPSFDNSRGCSFEYQEENYDDNNLFYDKNKKDNNSGKTKVNSDTYSNNKRQRLQIPSFNNHIIEENDEDENGGKKEIDRLSMVETYLNLQQSQALLVGENGIGKVS